MKTPYSELKRDCQHLHNLTENDIDKFISIVKINKNEIILDAMAGNGAIAKELSKKDINLYVLDKSEFQINEAKNNIKNAKFYVASALKMPFKNNFFDKVFIRSSIYEVPKKQQISLYKEILRVLKKHGSFINWTWKIDETNKKTFQKLIKEKDKIAGFDELVKNRYFPTKEEFEEDIKKAGFSRIEFFNLDIHYTPSTQKWFEIDFKKDKKKLTQLNNYIKSIGKIPNIEINEISKDNLEIKVPALISVAIK